MRWVGLIVALAVWLVAPRAFAGAVADAESREQEARVDAELAAVAPDMVDAWRRANAAYDKHDVAGFRAAASEVMVRVPKFAPGRRLFIAGEVMAQNYDAARALATELLKEEPGPESERTMAIALASAAMAKEDSRRDSLARESLTHALNGVRAMPDRVRYLEIWCMAAIAARDLEAIRKSSDALARVDADLVTVHFARFLYEGSQGNLDAARASLDRAHALGMTDEEYETRLEHLDSARPWPLRAGIFAAKIGGTWLVVLFALVGAAALLSRLTLKHATQAASTATPRVSELRLRKIYRAVIGATCAFYYVSLPLLAIGVLFTAGAVILGFLMIGYLPIKLMVILGIGALFTAWVVLKSALVRGVDADPGERVDLDANPRLREVLAEVAAKVGTRPVDSVYMTPFTDIAVFERGGIRAKVRGTAERCLVLGAGVLDGMDLQAFKGVLAHEYGHFKNEDTAGGTLSLAVRRSIFAMALGLAQSGMATWYNIAWHFVAQFHKVFVRVSHGATRLQEILADRWAAFAYGSEAFERGLMHVVQRSIAFEVHLGRTVDEVIEKKLPLANLYRYVPAASEDDATKVKEAAASAFERTADEYDSHPPPKDRIAWVRALAVEHVSGDRDLEAWSIFADRAALEAEMTGLLRDAAASRGIDIPSGPASPA